MTQFALSPGYAPGIVIAVLSPVYAMQENARRERLADPRTYDLNLKGYSFPMPSYDRVTPWPGVGVGAAMTAFGVLLLAIRRPITQ